MYHPTCILHYVTFTERIYTLWPVIALHRGILYCIGMPLSSHLSVYTLLAASTASSRA